MGGYSKVSETKNVNIYGNGATNNGAASQSAASNRHVSPPISVVNKNLSGDSVGDRLELKPIQNPMPASSPAGEYIVEQRTILRNQKLSEEGNINMTTEERQEKIKSYQDLEEIRKELVKKCESSGISFAKLSVLMTAITGKTPKEFHLMNPAFQEMLLNYIIESIDRVNNANLEGVDILEAVVTDAAMMYKFICCKDGVCVDIASLTPEQIKERREYIDKEFKERKAQKMAEYNKLSPEEQKIAKEKFLQEMSEERKHIFENLSKKISFESAFELLLIVSVQDLGDEARAYMESLPLEIREKIANTMHSLDTFKEYIKLAQGRGESLSDERAQEAWKQFNKIFGTYKSAEKLEEYEQQFMEARTRGELPEEVIKPSAMGIGEAAYANINMSTQEKESFIQKWVTDNNGILTDADIAQVESEAKEYIKELVDKNPEIRERFSYIKKTIKEIVEKTLEREFKPVKKQEKTNEKNDKTLKNNDNYSKENIVLSKKSELISNRVYNFVKEYIIKTAEKFECPAVEKTDEQVVNALLMGIIDEKKAIENLNNSEHKFILLCVKNDKLRDIYEERIMQYIKTQKDNNKLKEIAIHAPRKIVEKMVHYMHSDKRELAQELIKYHQVDYNTKVTLENTVLEKEAV